MRSGARRYGAWTGILLPLLLASARPARAESDAQARARVAYEQGLKAHAAGDHKAATRAFAAADVAVPSDEALEAALDEAALDGDAAFAMNLTLRAQDRKVDERTAAAVQRVRAAFRDRVGTLSVDCAGASVCRVALDAAAEDDAAKPRYVTTGMHTARVRRDGAEQTATFDVAAGETRWLKPEAPKSLVSPVPGDVSGRRSTLRAVVFVGAGLTVASLAATIVSGIDVVAKRSSFRDGGCAADTNSSGPVSPDCQGVADRGSAAQTRTNVLIAVTAALGVATLAVELFLVPSLPKARIGVAAGIGRADLSLKLDLP